MKQLLMLILKVEDVNGYYYQNLMKNFLDILKNLHLGFEAWRLLNHIYTKGKQSIWDANVKVKKFGFDFSKDLFFVGLLTTVHEFGHFWVADYWCQGFTIFYWFWKATFSLANKLRPELLAAFLWAVM